MGQRRSHPNRGLSRQEFKHESPAKLPIIGDTGRCLFTDQPGFWDQWMPAWYLRSSTSTGQVKQELFQQGSMIQKRVALQRAWYVSLLQMCMVPHCYMNADLPTLPSLILLLFVSIFPQPIKFNTHWKMQLHTNWALFGCNKRPLNLISVISPCSLLPI